jgi:mutator family transposase
VGTTTPTDPRSQRIRASRRGGHLLTRARSPSCKSGLPILRSSQRPCPGGSQPTRRAADGQPGAAPFILDTNPLERLNREIGRRTDVVGIFPDDASLIRLATSLVIEQNDEWLVGRRYLSLDSLAPLLEERRDNEEEVLELTAA